MSHSGAFAVIDGHGGQKAAEYIKENLVPELLQQRNLHKNPVSSIKQGKYKEGQFESGMDQKFLINSFWRVIKPEDYEFNCPLFKEFIL